MFVCLFVVSVFVSFLAGEDPETRRLRTVKNIADLRQNLEETMSSLRGTQVTHRSVSPLTLTTNPDQTGLITNPGPQV